MQLIMNLMMNNNNDGKKKISIPPGYRDMLRDMTVEVLRHQPEDPLTFCIDWLNERKSERGGACLTTTESAEKKKSGNSGLQMNKPAQPEPLKQNVHLEVINPDKVCKTCRLFSNVPPDDLEALSHKVEMINTDQGDELMFHGTEEPKKLYIVATGHFDLFLDTPRGKIKLAELINYGYFGDVKEEFRCVAKNPGKLIVVNRSDIDPKIFEKINEKRQLYKEFFEDMELLEKLTDFERRLIIDASTETDYPENTEIIKQGDPSEDMYFLFEGFGSVVLDGNEVNTVAEGGFFGELGLIEQKPRAATVISTSDVKVLSIPIDIFKHIIEVRCREFLDKTVKRYFKDPNAADEDEDSDMETPPFEKVNMPRKSVSAGKFNPEMLEEDDEEEIKEELKKPELQKTEEQKERLREVCKKILLFRCLDDDELEVVIGIMFPKEVTPGDIIIQLGDDGDNFYVIESGVYDIKVLVKGEETVVAQFNNEGSFGELALMYNTPRSATVQATSNGHLWALSRDMFRKIVLKKAFQKRIMYENLIGQVPLLKELSAYEKMNVADALRTRIYDAGSHIINQGDEGYEMYFIEEGHVEIYVDFEDGSQPELIGELERGKYFGEMALITHKPRAASAIAKTKCKIAVIDRESFERLLGPCVQIMKRNMEDYSNPTNTRKSMINE